MTESLTEFEPPRGRMRVIEGKAGSILIDDTYNSSPIALASALETLRGLEGKRKIAMLGDMLELGTYAEEEHWKAGREAGSFVDEFISVGNMARWMGEAAKSSGLPEACIHAFENSEDAAQFMLSIQKPGDIILLKGSQGSGAHMIRMERAVKILMAHPDQAPNLLVRQEEEWQKQYKT
jgi:UDP-N-acetylmuramyl pentapeptide synthase